MTEKQIGAAVIGYGGMGSAHAKELIPAVDAIHLCGVYDIDPARSEAAEKDGIFAYPSFEAVLDDPAVDFVVVAIPNDQHLPVCKRAMEAGKHVICEKPVALSHEELAEMIRTAKAHKVLFTVHQNRRWDIDFVAAKKIFDDNVLGPVFCVESRVHGSRGIPGDWRNKKAYGGGMVLDWGIHLIDQVLQMIDRPIAKVYAELSFVTNEECDDGFKILINFAGNLVAQIEVGTSNFISLPRWYMLGENGSAQLVGLGSTKGYINMVSDWENRAAVPVVAGAGLTKTMAPRDFDSIKEYPIPEVTADLRDYYENICDVLRGKAEPFVRHEELMRSMLVMEAAFESFERKTVITDFEQRYQAALASC